MKMLSGVKENIHNELSAQSSLVVATGFPEEVTFELSLGLDGKNKPMCLCLILFRSHQLISLNKGEGDSQNSMICYVDFLLLITMQVKEQTSHLPVSIQNPADVSPFAT